MDIRKQVAEIIGDYEFGTQAKPFAARHYGKADQIIPLVRADMQREIAPRIGSIIHLVLFRKFSTAQTALSKLYEALKSGTFKEGE